MKRIGLLLMSLLVVVALVLASCTPAAPADDGKGTTVEGKVIPTDTTDTKDDADQKDADGEPVDTGPKMVMNTAGKLEEQPQYGGSVTWARTSDYVGFDPATTVTWQNFSMVYTHDSLLRGDWAKGASGTGETGFLLYTFLIGGLSPHLADYELPDSTTIIFNVTKGVRWQNKPPVNGREFDAEDIVTSFTRYFATPESYLVATHKEGKRPLSITALDKYTVEIKVPEGTQGPIFRDLSTQTWPIAREIVETFGDAKDWRNSIGTGPWMIKDYVPGSSMTYERNPDYYMEDPLLPGNKLPYMDTFENPIIPDKATRLAALRTGKLDFYLGLTWEDKDSLTETNPEMIYMLTGISEDGIGLRTDVPPFDDINVRKALFLATDNKAILEDYYNGNAVMLNYPVKDLPDFRAAYTELADLDPEIQELFTYDPDKAKQLLADAGYPNGFKITMPTRTVETMMDIGAILQAQWALVGIDVELQPLEYGAYTTTMIRFTHENIIHADSLWTSSPYKAQTWGGIDQARNLARVETPYLVEQYDKIVANFLNAEERSKILKETVPYILKNAWYLQYPNQVSYTFWHPWLKRYNGEYCVGYTKFLGFLRYVWVDQDLKAEMLGN